MAVIGGGHPLGRLAHYLAQMGTAFARWSLVGLGTLLRGALPHWCCDAWRLLHSLRELTLESAF
jgi:hypothetical protein